MNLIDGIKRAFSSKPIISLKNMISGKPIKITPDDVMDDDPMVRECVARCFNNGECVFMTNTTEGISTLKSDKEF